MFSLPLGHAYAQPLLPCSQAGPPAHVARAPLPSICLPPVPRTRNMKAAGLANEGEFGARDPFEGEIRSNFADKVLGNADTSHVIRGPDSMAKLVGLSAKRCVPCEDGKAQALSELDANRLRNQVPGWRLVKGEGGVLSMKQEWKVRNFKAGLELFQRVAAVAEAEGHHPDLHLEGFNHAYAELSTHSVGGLTENDFIMAAKINAVDFTDLMPKKKARFWA